jgi:N-acyl-D-aspartate/D-glutamate deacylase
MLPLTLLALLAAADPVEADLVLKGGTVFDGTGRPGQVGDVAVKGDKVVAVGAFAVAGNPKVVDCAGLVVAPGFIDLHTHSDNPLQDAKTRANLSYAFQGMTTAVTGNCGGGPVNVAEFFQKLEQGGVGCNVIHQVPHNSVRRQVMGNVNRPPTADELAKMKDLVDRGMRDGAFGMATGLIYNPGTYCKTDELIELSRVVAKHGGHYASHIRDEGAGLLDAVREAITIGRDAGVPVHISHIKASGRANWGKAADAVGLIRQARAAGQKVTADQYPYPASSTGLSAMVVPARYREGSNADFVKRLDDPEQGPRLKAAIEQLLEGRNGGQSIRIASYSRKPAWQGKDLVAIADMEKRPVIDVALEILRNGGASAVSFGMSEEDVRLYMKQPWVATASDGSSKVPDKTVPHPRSYGTFPRKIGRYAIDEQVIPLEQAVRSSSGLPADILRLTDRGYLKPGQFADVVVFDPKTFRDTATYDQPHQYATGVRLLLVNGQAVIEGGAATNKLPGRVLRHGEKTKQ